MTARPIVRWVGGKTKLLPELQSRLPATYDRYFEPFAGGAALFFALAPECAVLSDLNADLIGMYRALAEQPEAVLGVLGRLEELHGEEHYYQTRDEFNERPGTLDPHDRAAAFLYLNRACFNGLWRVNASGQMNSPIGRDSNGEINRITLDEDNLRAASAALARAEIRCGDYRDAVRAAEPGDLVYMDSPYDALGTPWSRAEEGKGRSFTSYCGAFGPAEQVQLAGVVRDLVSRGVHVLASNHDTPLVRQLYAGLRIDVVQCARPVAAKPGARGKVDELIIVGEPAPRRRRAHAREQMELLAIEVSHG